MEQLFWATIISPEEEIELHMKMMDENQPEGTQTDAEEIDKNQPEGTQTYVEEIDENQTEGYPNRCCRDRQKSTSRVPKHMLKRLCRRKSGTEGTQIW